MALPRQTTQICREDGKVGESEERLTLHGAKTALITLSRDSNKVRRQHVESKADRGGKRITCPIPGFLQTSREKTTKSFKLLLVKYLI